MAGLHTLTGALWSEEYQSEIVTMSLRVLDRHPEVVGEHMLRERWTGRATLGTPQD